MGPWRSEGLQGPLHVGVMLLQFCPSPWQSGNRLSQSTVDLPKQEGGGGGGILTEMRSETRREGCACLWGV